MISRQLDKDNEIPLYLQLAKILEDGIAEGRYKKGTKLPSEHDLVQTYNISRVTVRQTMKYLTEKGIVIRKQGLGTFIKNTVVKTTVAEVVGFYPSLLRHGIKPVTKIIEYRIIAPEPHVRESLKLSKTEKVLKFVRQYFIDEVPFLVTEIYIPDSIAEKWTVTEATEKNSLQLIKEKTGLNISHSDITIKSSGANGVVADYLKVPHGSPILELRRLTYAVNNQPVDYAVVHYRGDTYELTTTITVTEQNTLLVNTPQILDASLSQSLI